MTFKTIATGSDGNSFILTNNAGHHLMIEAGLPMGELKKGIDYDIENWQGLVCSHSHKDHSLSVMNVRKMGIPIFLPYKFDKPRMRTMLGDFVIETFPVPHNGCENRGLIINTEGQRICFLIDLEYCPYDLSKQHIDVLVVECNYISDLVDENLPNIVHKTLGHCELQTTIGIIQSCEKHLRKVILTHMSKGATMDKKRALQEIRDVIPSYIEVTFAKRYLVEDISETPF